eukprot:CAMPEP_0119006186 /NCGR_PEP_ID=MMETSP1176-20130426/2153_1 /TAXON_ID=265551 /ORGANISM="Synedropsis recta cf, Strain CCMP1620" /LENGTH=1320 /DNA_ID=CAMNT_0006958075 /DNA_START=89 /DNA_END=4051 /DNA_ORIENTATION=+
MARRNAGTSRRRKSVQQGLTYLQEASADAIPVTKTASSADYVSFVTEWLHRDVNQEKKEPPPRRVSILALLSYSTVKERWLMVLGVIMATISGLTLPAWLVLLAMSLDKFSNIYVLIEQIGGNGLYDFLLKELNQLAIGFVCVGFVSLISGSSYVALWTYSGEKQTLRIQKAFVRAALQQDAAWFDTYDREEMPTRMGTSMVNIQAAIGRQMVDTYSMCISASGSLAVALVLNTPLALIMLLVVPFVGIVVGIFSCWTRSISRNAQSHLAKAGTLATEVVHGIKTITALCAQAWALATYESKVRDAQKCSIRSSFLSTFLVGITGMMFYITYTMAFIIGTEQVSNDASMISFVTCLFDSSPNCRVTGASVMCCIYGVILCVTYFGLMGPGIAAINMGRQAASEIFDTLERKPEINDESGEEIENLKGHIEWDQVFFAYPSRPKKMVFSNLSLQAKPGESLALVGPSGSGKSTIARLLLRFYDPLVGEIRVDGKPLDKLTPSWWRDQVGYVAQEPILFPGSIRYNIAVGKPGATEEDVIAAAKAACAHDFITELPDGYDTLYSGTSLLSGGQLQRIAIARAIIKNPTLLLLDEATSALDSTSEQHVQQALANVRKVKSMTTIMVAHRLSTVIGCDQIAVIADGSIAELGTHRSLMEQNGIYFALCFSQGITADTKALELTDEPKPIVEEALVSKDTDTSGGDIEEAIRGSVKAEDAATEEEDEPEQEELASFSRMWKYTKADSLYTMIGLLGSIIVGALSPAESILTANIVANFYTVEPRDMLEANRKWILSFLIFALASFVGHAMIGCGLSVAGNRLTRRLRLLAFNSIIRRNMGWFDRPEHSTGELIARLGADAETAAAITGIKLGYRLRVTTSLITGVTIAMIYEWKIGLTALACVPLIMLASLVQAIFLRKRFVVKAEGMSPATILEQGLRGISSVQAYNLQETVGNDYAVALQPESDGKVKQGVVAGITFGFSQFAIFCSFAIVFYVGSILLVNQQVDFLGFFVPVLAVMFGALGASQVSTDFKAKQDGMAAAARIFLLVDEPLDESDPFSDKGEKPDHLDGSIAFNKVHFAYPTRPDNEIFYKSDLGDGLSLDIAAKESVAFVGKSGCGKSTAEALALRFYEATEGQVLVDGHMIQDLNVAWLRQHIGYVGQQPILFSGSVRDNILLGKPDATEEEVVEAAKAANAHEFVEKLADGYGTDIGTGGSTLSGGQKQRLAIARAIVSNPSILVLDEATSALDNESEKIVQAALDDLQRKQPRTTLVVAHRLTTVKECDRIAVLGGGGVEELGSHQDLLEQKGLYSTLWKLQGSVDKED